MAAVKTARTIIASTTNAAAATTRGRIDLTTVFGGILTIKMTNGATGPSAACRCNILIAHNATQPAEGGAGADWKTIQMFIGSVDNNGVVERSMVVEPSIMQLEVEFTGNTGQSVTVESFLSELTSVA